MNTVVIYTQFLDKHERVLSYGIQMAKHLEKTVKIVHVIDTRNMDFYKGFSDPDGTLASASSYELMKQYKKEADTFFGNVKTEYQTLFDLESEIQTRVEIGNTEMILSEEVNDKDTYIFVLPHSFEGEVRYLINSNTYYIEEASCPVMVIPQEAEFRRVENIVYATDYQEQDIESIKIMANLAEKFQAKLTAFHVVDEKERFTESLEDKGFRSLMESEAKYQLLDFKSIENEDDDVAKAIINYAESNNTDIIAVLKENRNFWERIFHESVSKKVIKESKLPVIVFNKDMFS
jgi:nucleotide-binding universal stress UspA family protein